jgi:spore germination protein PC
MNEDFYSYIRKLHAFIEGQERRIKRLEQCMQEMDNEIKELKARPAITVDKIEYKFDQLKVETLEGTLNIGLNPSDLQGIEDFSVNNQNVKTQVSPTDMRSVVEIEDTILNFIESDTENIVASCEQSLQRKFDSGFVTIIKEDIKKQLSNRISYYMNQLPPETRSNELSNEHQNQIIEQLKLEIEKGIYTFLSNLPDEKKGMN